MSTAAQIAANPENAKSSTGPKTAEGKAAAAQNNFRHGLRSKFTILASEDPQEFASISRQKPSEPSKQPHVSISFRKESQLKPIPISRSIACT